MEYNHREIEKRWQQRWQEEGIYTVKEDASRPKFYVLDMFPYPSGAGLHVGHPLGYIASDIIARYKRQQGFNVLHPMGFDAYGLPAEQYAIQTGQHPEVTTEANIRRYKEQLGLIGLGYDWSREVRTCDPSYYKWTQWAFMRMFGSWYDTEAQKARPITELEAHFAAYGTEGLEDGFDDDDAEEFEAGGKVRVDLRDVDALRLGQDLDFDIQVLRALLTYADAVTPERDAKLVKLRDFIAGKVSEPYNPGNRKVLVFSAFADTTAYLFEQLAPWLKRELGIECAEVAGSSNRTYSLKLPRTTFENILARFSPVSKELPESQRELGEIDVVFATDCISEGQNLQDCDCLVNYDIHWNPVRIIQRFGRIDRLGSENKEIQLVNFWPDIALDEYIQLEGRVKGRMVLMDASATGEENVLESKAAGEMNDLKYRRQQLEQLRTEVLDLEDISGGISITDFAFDDFRVELQRYAKDNPGLLETSPVGLHAIAPIPDELKGEVRPGVIFCLKQNDERKDPKDTNPTFPYYVVYVTDDGARMTKHTQPKPALDLMRAACSGQHEPLLDLCKTFNAETRDGLRMDAYTDLLDDVVAAITGVQETKGMESLFSLGEVGSGVTLGFNDYSLLSFLVLR